MGIPNLGKTVFILRPGPRHYSFPHLNDIFNQTGAVKPDIICLMQDCSISSVLAIEILQSCTKPSTYSSYWTCNLDFGKYQWIPKIVINITKDAKYFWIGYFDKRTCSLSAWRISGHARNSTIIAHCTPNMEHYVGSGQSSPCISWHHLFGLVCLESDTQQSVTFQCNNIFKFPERNFNI